MTSDPKWYAIGKSEVARACKCHRQTVLDWTWLDETKVKLEDGQWAYDLTLVWSIRYRKLEQAPQSRKIARESGSAVTYADKKDREQAWKLRYERLETQQKYVAKLYVQNSLRRWALAFPGPLKEFVALVVSMVPGHQKAAVKEQGLNAIAQCMMKVRDLAVSFGAEIDTEEKVKPKAKRKYTKNAGVKRWQKSKRKKKASDET